MEAIITVVGFLGAGKTTLLKRLMSRYIERDWSPFIILNDYENAYLDIQQFLEHARTDLLAPLARTLAGAFVRIFASLGPDQQKYFCVLNEY